MFGLLADLFSKILGKNNDNWENTTIEELRKKLEKDIDKDIEQEINKETITQDKKTKSKTIIRRRKRLKK